MCILILVCVNFQNCSLDNKQSPKKVTEDIPVKEEVEMDLSELQEMYNVLKT